MGNRSWLPVSDDSDFPLENLPYGVFSIGDSEPRVGAAIGEHIVDLAPVLEDEVFRNATLNPFMARGRGSWVAARRRLTQLLSDDALRDRVEPLLVPRDEARMHLPFEVADYVDFFSSEHHARNVGRIFRPDGDPLPPSWKHLPMAYHGRAGTVVVSGTPIVRPSGQRRAAGAAAPTYGPC